jgi:leader peptidase (prepilin peptidase) / N-methyltransferase
VTAAVICALAGLIVGSFLNPLIDRIPIKDPAARVPLHTPPECSWCDANRGLGALIPIVGALRACPSCGEKPRRRELVGEIVTAGLFVAMSIQIHDPLVLLAYLLFSAFIVAVSAIDLEHYRIPDRIVFPMLAISVPAIIAISFSKDVPEAITRALLGGVTFFGVLLVFHLISPRGMGFGDVKLGLVLGLYTGWLALDLIEAPYLAIIALFFGAIIGVVVGLVVALSRGRKAAFPFGPALCAGACLVVLFSDSIVG